MQTLEQRQQLAQMLEALQLLLGRFFTPRHRHGDDQSERKARLSLNYADACKTWAEQD